MNLNLFSRDFLHLLSGGEADGTSNTVALPGCKLRATVSVLDHSVLKLVKRVHFFVVCLSFQVIKETSIRIRILPSSMRYLTPTY